MQTPTFGWGKIGLGMMLLCWPTGAWAQTEPPRSAPASIVRTVVRDPTTYAPVLLKFSAMNLDWESSQVFFRHGFLERNARFTVSGRSTDTAINHAAGSRKIVVDSLLLLAQTVPEHLAERTIERMLLHRFAEHEKIVRVAGRIGRIAGTSYLSYSASMGHFRQWQRNERLARQLGYK